MSKSCIKCSKELGFRDKKWDAKHVAFWCATYWHHEIPVGDKTCDEPSSDMGKKDSICAMCYQAHCLEHHLMAMVDHERETNKGLLRRGKFKKFMETIPLGLSEIAPTWDLDVTGNETNGQLYDKMTEKIQNTERGCPWCKKYFQRRSMTLMQRSVFFVEMGLMNSEVIREKLFNIGGLECPNCAEIRSGLTSVRLRNLKSELSKLNRKADSVSMKLVNAEGANKGAERGHKFELLAFVFSDDHKRDGVSQEQRNYYSREASARLTSMKAEEREVVLNISDIMKEIEEERLILAEEHFGAPTLLPKRKGPRREETSSSCNNCGNSLKPTTKFCGKCGNQV